MQTRTLRVLLPLLVLMFGGVALAQDKECKDCGFQAEHSYMGWPYCGTHYDERRQAQQEKESAATERSKHACAHCGATIVTRTEGHYYISGRGQIEFFDTLECQNARWSCEHCSRPLSNGHSVTYYEHDGGRICLPCYRELPPAARSGSQAPVSTGGATADAPERSLEEAPAQVGWTTGSMALVGGMLFAGLGLLGGAFVWISRQPG